MESFSATTCAAPNSSAELGVQIIVKKTAQIDLVEGVRDRRRLRQRIVDRDGVVLGHHLRGRQFLGIGEQVAVDRGAARPVIHRVGVAQYSGNLFPDAEEL